MKVWESKEYQRIINAAIDKNSLIVEFENKDIVSIQFDTLFPNRSLKVTHIQSVSFNEFEIELITEENKFQIPWDKVRVITDKEFSRHMAIEAEEQAKTIGEKIKTLREQRGLKSNELAERASLTPQTISRIEKGHTDVSFTTLKKILAVMGFSLQDLAIQESESELDASPKDLSFLMKRMNKLGIDSRMLTKRIFPRKLQEVIDQHSKKQPEMILDEAATYIHHVFGWQPDQIWSNSKLDLSNDLVESMLFKSKKGLDLAQVKAYAHYASYLSKLLLKAIPFKDPNYPDDISTFKNDFIKKYKILNFENLFRYSLDIGVCILPLNDSGYFHGASWNINDRHIIVIKQKSQYHARWIFDLLHELYHVFAHLEYQNSSILEIEELSPLAKDLTGSEEEANYFANQVIFDNRAEEIAEKCVEEASWRLENLKKAVHRVAMNENIQEDFISNYLAYRLAIQGQNWWSTASNMQIIDPNPFYIAVNILKERIDTKRLNPIETNLLFTAFS